VTVVTTSVKKSVRTNALLGGVISRSARLTRSFHSGVGGLRFVSLIQSGESSSLPNDCLKQTVARDNPPVRAYPEYTVQPSTDKEAPLARRRNRGAEVVDAAIETFYTKGYSAASIQDVADAVGVLKGSLYYYIDSKEDLLVRICDAVHATSRQMLDDVLALDAPPLEQLHAYISAHVTWYLKETKMVGVYFRDWRFLTGERLETVRRQRRGYATSMRKLITAAKAAGDVDPGLNDKYAAFFILAAVNAVPDWYRAGGRDSPRTIARTYADLTVATLSGTRSR
jgi:AcrR family transcriptional regulator